MLIGDVKLELERTLSDQMNAQDSLVKLETIIANLEQDKKKLQADLKKVHIKLLLVVGVFLNCNLNYWKYFRRRKKNRHFKTSAQTNRMISHPCVKNCCMLNKHVWILNRTKLL